MTQPDHHPLTIGVFDSGFGGLTVLRALLPLIPGARFLYLGDTARLPYGSKSRETVARYAISSSRFLLDHGADLLVIACNTATALALPEIEVAAAPIRVIGVIAPGAEAAAEAPSADNETTPHVLVLATAATVQSHAYTAALEALHLRATEKACPLLVPLVEEGWLPGATRGPGPQASVTAEVLRIYLAEAQALAPDATALLLGCTHYPLLNLLIRQTLSDLNYPLHLIDSAEATAHATERLVATLFPDRIPPSDGRGAGTPATATFYATDSTEKFARLGPRFLGRPLPEVHLIDLGG